MKHILSQVVAKLTEPGAVTHVGASGVRRDIQRAAVAAGALTDVRHG